MPLEASSNDSARELGGGRGSRTGWLRAILAGALLVGGLAAGAAAFAASLGRQAPELAVRIWPLSGAAYERAGNFALARAVKDPREGVPNNLPAKIATHSRDALRLEPVSNVAVRNLGLYFASRGQEARAFELMTIANRMSRRDPAANLWLVQHYGRRNDIKHALALYDITIRTDTAASAAIMAAMTQALSRPGAADLFLSFLATAPPWLDDFWTEVLRANGDLRTAAELRRGLHREGVRMEPEHDQLLIQKLADNGHFEQAFALYSVISPARGTNELLADPSFEASGSFPPIGWKVVAESTHGSSIDPAAGVLEATALPDAEGIIAQQVVALGGSRTLRIAAEYEGVGSAPLLVNVACADRGNDAQRDVAVPSGAPVTVTLSSACRFAWVSLKLPRDNNPDGRAVRVSSVSLKAAG